MRSNLDLPPNIHRTNYVPSPEERDVICSLISLHQERLLVVDAEVIRAEENLYSLQLEQRVQRDLLTSHQALLTPMRRLVPDLLLQIFHHCWEDSYDEPMRLVSVCKQWRELALSTPTLWTHVVILDTLPTTRIVPYARACAQRSGSCDLWVLINVMNTRPEKGRMRRALVEALQILVQHVHRWKSFDGLMHKAYKLKSDEVVVAAAPRLERLAWYITDEKAPLPFSSFPNVQHLRLFSLHPLDIPLLLQCTKLRYFRTIESSGGLTLTDCLTILSNCPSLETFEVSCIKTAPNDIVHEGLISLPCLHRLRIGPFALDPAPLIHLLDTPSLQSLYLLVGKSMDFDSSCIRRLVHNCRPPLISLSLVNVANSSDIVSCLPLLPHLKSLVLQQASGVDLILSPLLEQNDAGCFVCPVLEHLGLRLCLFTGRLLVEFARARRTTAGGLRILVGEINRYKAGEFKGFTIELERMGEFSDEELEELYALQTTN